MERNRVKRQNEGKKPSLLRQLVDKVDEMDEGAKKLLLLSLKKDELSEKYKKLDHSIAKSGALLSEEKIDKIVSDTRKKLYDKSPDPKDNFLFDLAIQSGSEVIVSDEKKIISLSGKSCPCPKPWLV